MTQVDLNKIAYSSFFPGIGNYDEDTLNIVVPAQTLDGTAVPEGRYATRGNITIDNTYAVSQVKVALTGLDSTHYFIKGTKELYYNGGTRVYSALSAKYSVVLYSYFQSGQYKMEVLVLSQDFFDAAISVPAFTVNVSLKLFKPPFENFPIS